MDEPVVRNDCEAQREGPEPRCNENEPVQELRHAAFRRSYVEDEERQRNREDGVANPFCPVGFDYLRPVLSLSSFDEPSPLMKFSRQLLVDPAVGAGQRIAFALPG